MASENFEACLKFTLKYEGGYVDHPADPGGATNLGITRRTLAAWRGRPVTKTEVRALTRADAAEIYRKNYWDAVCGDDLPQGVDAAVFDHAVNSGPGAATRMLQRAAGVKADGRIGPVTIAVVRARNPADVIGQLISRRRSFLQRLKTFRIFGRGWTARVAALERTAHAMAKAAARPAGTQTSKQKERKT